MQPTYSPSSTSEPCSTLFRCSPYEHVETSAAGVYVQLAGVAETVEAISVAPAFTTDIPAIPTWLDGEFSSPTYRG